MALHRREFLTLLAAAASTGFPLARVLAADRDPGDVLYDLPPPSPSCVSLLHFTDCHAQLQPLWLREPSVNLGVGTQRTQPPHLVGDALLQAYGLQPGSAAAHAISPLDFTECARRFGQVGGFAHLATLVGRLRDTRPGALLLDGGDTWQGSATALWTDGRDMLAACRQLGVDAMTAHWEFTLGAQRVREILAQELGSRTAFLAQNVHTLDFGDPVFTPWMQREVRGVPVAVIGQAFPYTPIAHPRRLVPDWTFGISERTLQQHIDHARQAGCQVVVLLSHNGLDVDLKLASRVRGLDAILGGHTHDALPQPIRVANAGGQTLVTNAGSHGKFLGVLDVEVRHGRVQALHYRLLPVFARYLPADPAMAGLIRRLRTPYEARLAEQLATSDGLLYRRGTFNGTFDQLILQALMEVQDAEIGFSPGFRWGATLLPGETITRETLLGQTAITYPETTLQELTGAVIHANLEDIADNLFNPDPYARQGGDMVRVGGLTYTCAPEAAAGRRIRDLRLHGKPLAADRRYRVAGWATSAPPGQGLATPGSATPESGGHGPTTTAPPVWEVVETWLKQHRQVPPLIANQPRLVAGDDGVP